MKKILFLLLFLPISYMSNAQDDGAEQEQSGMNSLSVNFFGYSSLASITYERRSIISDKLFLSTMAGWGINDEFRIDFCFVEDCNYPPEENYHIIPHHLTFNLGKKNHWFEFGLAGSYIIGDRENSSYRVHGLLAYRFSQHSKKGVLFRIFAQYGLFKYKYANPIAIPIGLSVGKSF